MAFLKRDKLFARLKDSSLAKRGGIYLYYAVLSPDELKDWGIIGSEGEFLVGIRIGRCHRKAVERNKIRRRVKEALRSILSSVSCGEKVCLFLISVGIKDKEPSYKYIEGILKELLTGVFKETGIDFH